MIPWNLLGTARVPGDGAEMRLHQRGTEYSIRVGAYELMNSRVFASEEALASLVCERLGSPNARLGTPNDRLAPGPNARLLIGGLGMGFTLAGVLARVGDDAEVVVAELVPEVVTWNRGPLGEVAGRPLDDARVTVVERDVVEVIAGARELFDAILLDVDNGPAGLTSGSNDRLYALAGLRAANAALRPHGILAVWSAGPDAAFTRRLQQAGFEAEEVPVRGRAGKRGPRYLIWIARRR